MFFCLTIYTLVKMCSKRIPYYRRQKLGYRYKIVFLLVLVLSLIIRSLGIIAVYVIQSMDLQLFWLAQLLKTAPSLLHFTAYSIFLYFYGKLCTFEENSYNISRPILIGLNVIAYGIYTFIAVYYQNGPIPNYMRVICGYYGVLYLIFWVLLIIFGAKVCLILFTKKNLSNAAIESQEFKTFKSISWRTICLTGFLIIIYFVRAVYNLLYLLGVMDSIFSLDYYWLTSESVFFLLTEFMPSLVTIMIVFSEKVNVFINQFDSQGKKFCSKPSIYIFRPSKLEQTVIRGHSGHHRRGHRKLRIRQFQPQSQTTPASKRVP